MYVYDKNLCSVSNFDKMFIHMKIHNRPILIENFLFKNHKYILTITEQEILVFDLRFTMINKFSIEMNIPVSLIFKKKQLLIYIYDKNNSFIEYNLKNLSNFNF